MRTQMSSKGARVTRRSLLGQLAALAMVPTLATVGTLAACTPSGRPDAAGPAPASAQADAPKSGAAPSASTLKTLEVATVYPYLGYLPLYAAIQRGQLSEQRTARDTGALGTHLRTHERPPRLGLASLGRLPAE